MFKWDWVGWDGLEDAIRIFNKICQRVHLRQLLWYLISRQTRFLKNKRWILDGDPKEVSTFLILKYCLISRLDCSRNFHVIPDNLDFQLRHFYGRSIIYISNIENRLTEMTDEAVDVNIEKLKLESIFFFQCCFVAP